jgi:thiol-disulfide isomerase/thioredoxin
MDPVIRSGSAAPDFSLPDLQGRVHSLQDVRGRILVLDFWSSECPWSARAEDEMGRLEPGWGGRVAIWRVASNANEPLAALHAAAARSSGLILLRDEAHVVADAYGAQTTPHLFVIDAGGTLRYQGALNDVTFRQRAPTRGYLAEAVAALLQGGAPDPAETPAYGCAIVRVAA